MSQNYTCKNDEFEKDISATGPRRAAERFADLLWSNHDYWEKGDGYVFDIEVVDHGKYKVSLERTIEFHGREVENE